MRSQIATSNQQLNLPLSVFYVPFASRYRLSVAYGSKVAKSPISHSSIANPLQQQRVILSQNNLRTNPSNNSKPRITHFLLNNPPLRR